MANDRNEQPLFLVTGATGRHGGAVARRLLERGHEVRALTRDPNKPAARALTGMGAEVTRGDLDDRPSVERALEGAYGVFAVQNFWEAGYEREVRQGITLADAAKAQGVEHFVYSSVGSSYRKTGIAAFDGEWEIEEHIRGTGLPYTVLRPTSLMEDWEEMREEIIGGKLAQPLDPDKLLQQVSVDDVGACAAVAFEDPEGRLGREVDLAGDESTMLEIAETFGQVMVRKVEYAQVRWDEFREMYGEELAVMYEWFNKVGYEADIAALREEYPGLTIFERYLYVTTAGRGPERSGRFPIPTRLEPKVARSVRATFYLYTSRLRASRVTPTAVDGAFSAGLHEYVSRLHVEQTNQTVQNAPVGTFLGSHLFRAPPRLRGRHIRHWRPEGSQRNQRRVIDGVLTPS